MEGKEGKEGMREREKRRERTKKRERSLTIECNVAVIISYNNQTFHKILLLCFPGDRKFLIWCFTRGKPF
jgi:hypothetical protein